MIPVFKILKLIRFTRKVVRMVEGKDAEVEEVNLGVFKSKTIWFGILQLAFSLGAALAGGTNTETAVLAFVSGVTTIVLRAATNKPLSEK